MFGARSRAVRWLTAVVLGLPVAGCDGDATGPTTDREPDFSAELSGGDLARLDGVAAFRIETHNGGADRGFTLHLVDDDVSGDLVLRTLTDALPTVGDHSIVPAEDRENPAEFRGTLHYVAGGVLQEFEVRSGLIRVTAARGAQIEGTVELRASRDADGQQVILTGTFSARHYNEVFSESSHTLSVSGALTQTLSGSTLFGPVIGANGSRSWGIVFRQTPVSGALSLGRIDAATRPAVGTYQVSGTSGTGVQFQGNYVAADDAETIGTFTLQSGTVTIIESSATRLRGTVNLVALGSLTSDPAVEREVAIHGIFDGRPGDIISYPPAATAARLSANSARTTR
jgi:hypothetical protein